MTGSNRILIVDDDTFLLKLIEVNLGQEGYSVSTVADAETGFTLVENNPYDLVVVDLVMPGMNGFQVARTLLQYSPALQIILISAVGDPQYDAAAKTIGAKAFLRKRDFSAEAIMKLLD